MGSKLRRATFVKALWPRQDSRQETPRYRLSGCSARGCRWPSLDEAQAPNAPVAKHEAKVTTCRMQSCHSFQRFLAKPFKKMFCCFFETIILGNYAYSICLCKLFLNICITTKFSFAGQALLEFADLSRVRAGAASVTTLAVPRAASPRRCFA